MINETGMNGEERKEKKARIDRTFKRIISTGLATICLAAPLAFAGLIDTTRNELKDANLDGSRMEYVTEHRSPILNYAWGSIALGNAICASSVAYKIRRLKKMEIDRWE